MIENNATVQEQTGKTRRDRWVRPVFLIIALVAAGTIWVMQRSDPELKGWDTDFNAALQHANETGTNVVVFFTRQPMGYEDKRAVDECISAARTEKAMRHLGYVKVHLTTKTNKVQVEQFGVSETPAVILLDPDGKVIRKHEGFINDLNFCTGFLGISGKELLELQ